MTKSTPYIIRAAEQESYSPANHTGTRNTRLVGPRVNGAKNLEIALGEIERLGSDVRDGFAAAVADCEQAQVILFSDERIGRIHEAVADHRVLFDGEDHKKDHHHRDHGKRDQRVGQDAHFLDDFLGSDRRRLGDRHFLPAACGEDRSRPGRSGALLGGQRRGCAKSEQACEKEAQG